MANAHIVLAQGAVDGSNTVFGTGEPYVPGSVAYILNGRIHSQQLARGPGNDYGFVELDPAAGTIKVDNAPTSGDVVQLFFWDRKVALPPAVERIVGVVNTPQRAQGVVRAVAPARLAGVIRVEQTQGVARAPVVQRLSGVVQARRIVGVIKEKC